MPLGAEIAAHLPRLRRYARALTGSQPHGDALVRLMLEEALADPARRTALQGGRLPLYRAFTELWNRLSLAAPLPHALASGAEAAAQNSLAPVTPRSRQALLLTALEEFSPAEAAAIMGTTPLEVGELGHQAMAEIARAASTEVLIIEDEPLIALQLEEIVRAHGHSVFATAATRTQAVQSLAHGHPGLVLADIQLADGSSGLDAVEDILGIADVPVVFVTAYPERLLSGVAREPTWLVTKPCTVPALLAAMAQALFFRTPAKAEATSHRPS
jgi:CheY-like chemotaxis protein